MNDLKSLRIQAGSAEQDTKLMSLEVTEDNTTTGISEVSIHKSGYYTGLPPVSDLGTCREREERQQMTPC
jgi:hypothetical protein